MPQIDHERAEDEAADWLLLLAEAPEDAALQARFEAWRSADPRHAEIWARTSRAYDLIGPAAKQATQKPILQVIANPSAARGRNVARAAALALAAALLIAIAPAMLLRLQADASTVAAEIRSVTLADGSQLRLAPESAVSFDLSGSQRQVRVLKGRAYFDVTPDAARPFTVQAGDTLVTVVGTAFDVRRGDSDTTVSVSHGRVRVENATLLADGAALLGVGDVLDLGPAGVERRRMNVEEVADWRDGRLTLRDATVAEVIDELRPYFQGFIFAADDAFSRQRVSGVYELTDPVGTLSGLAAAHKGQLRQISPWIIRIEKQP